MWNRCLFLAVVCWGLACHPVFEVRSQDEFRVALPISHYDPKAVPYLATSGSESMINTMIYSTLFHQSPDTELKPCLAEVWQVSEDGTVWDIKLKSGILFHDSTPLTADDVAYSFHYVMGHDESFYKEATRSIAKIEVLGDHDIRFTLTRPDAFFAYAAKLIAIAKKGAFEDEAPRHPIGTGAFSYRNYDPQKSTVTLHANPRYFESPAAMQTVTFYLLKNETEGLALFEKGLVDFIYLLDPTYENVFKNNPDRHVFHQQSPLYYLLVLNPLSPRLGSVEIRRALREFIDNKSMARQMDVKSLGVWQSFDYQHPPVEEDNTERRREAAALLAQRASALTGMTIASIAEHEFGTIILNQLTRELEKVGIKPQPVLGSFSTLLANSFPYGKYDAAIYPMNVKHIQFCIFNYWHTKRKQKQGLNLSGLNFDRELERMRYAPTEAERREAFREFEAALAQNPPFVFLFERFVPMVIHKKFTGYSETPWDFTLEIRNLRVKPAEVVAAP